jgi:hypothetical protein
MLEQWGKSGMPRDAWSKVNEVAQQFLAQRILQAYVDGNAFLIREGVLPTIGLGSAQARTCGSNPHRAASRACVGAGGH